MEINLFRIDFKIILSISFVYLKALEVRFICFLVRDDGS